MTREDAARHVGKVFAFLAVGKVEQARTHAQQLIAWLQTI